jgi:hypothetical protein
MVGECFPWSPASSSSSASSFVYTQANHKSVLGIGAYAKRAGEQLQLIVGYMDSDTLPYKMVSGQTCSYPVCILLLSKASS